MCQVYMNPCDASEYFMIEQECKIMQFPTAERMTISTVTSGWPVSNIHLSFSATFATIVYQLSSFLGLLFHMLFISTN